MASSEVDIVNIALTAHLGARSIEDFNDNSKEAKLARTSYNDIRKSVMRAHPWNCCMKRTSISTLEDAPVWGFDYAYQTPVDCLRVLEVNGETWLESWQVENNQIVTDLSPPIEIRYIFDNTSVGSYDPEFIDALSYKLAYSWVEPLVKAANLKKLMFDFYKAALSSARGTDGQEGSPRKIEANRWLDVR
jgi:hypothetical protein